MSQCDYNQECSLGLDLFYLLAVKQQYTLAAFSEIYFHISPDSGPLSALVAQSQSWTILNFSEDCRGSLRSLPALIIAQ